MKHKEFFPLISSIGRLSKSQHQTLTYCLDTTERMQATQYSYEQHSALEDASVFELFMLCKQEIFAMDGCVTEKINQRYIAFKAKSNFVDIFFKYSKELHLCLNMRFHDLKDRRSMAKDFTGKDHTGNGDVIIPNLKQRDVPYVISLVRQSLDRQMKHQANDD